MNHIVKLGTVATYVNGYAFKPSDWSDVGVPIIRIQDLTGNSYQMNRFSGEYDKKYEVQNGDVLIAWSASLGVYVWKSEKAVLNQHIFKVYFDKVDVDKDFFVYQMERLLQKASSQAHGATMRHLTKVVFDNLPFYLPDKETQIEIAKRLSTVTALIDLRKKELVKLDELVKSRFIEMFGNLADNRKKFDIVTIGEICSVIKDGTHQTPTYTDDAQNGFKFLSSKDVMSQKIDWSNIKYIPKELHEKLYMTIKPQRNDILLSKNGVNYGVAAVNDTDEVFDIYVSLALLRPKDIIDSIYFRCVINSVDTKRQFDRGIKGIGVPNLHLGEIKKVKVLLPPLKLQREFACFSKQIDKSKLAVQKSLDELETLKKSLMQQYFG